MANPQGGTEELLYDVVVESSNAKGRKRPIFAFTSEESLSVSMEVRRRDTPVLKARASAQLRRDSLQERGWRQMQISSTSSL